MKRSRKLISLSCIVALADSVEEAMRIACDNMFEIFDGDDCKLRIPLFMLPGGAGLQVEGVPINPLWRLTDPITITPTTRVSFPASCIWYPVFEDDPVTKYVPGAKVGDLCEMKPRKKEKK